MNFCDAAPGARPRPLGEISTSISPLVRSREPKRAQIILRGLFVVLFSGVLWCCGAVLVAVVFGACDFRFYLCCGCDFCLSLLLFVVFYCFFCFFVCFCNFCVPLATKCHNCAPRPNIYTHFAPLLPPTPFSDVCEPVRIVFVQKRSARKIVEAYYTRLTLDFQTNKRVCLEKDN